MTRGNSYFDSFIFWDIFILDLVLYSTGVCTRLKSPEIDSKESIPPAYVAWQAGTSNRVVVPAHQAGNRFLGLLNGLRIYFSETAVRVTMNKWKRELMMRPGIDEVKWPEWGMGGRVKKFKTQCEEGSRESFVHVLKIKSDDKILYLQSSNSSPLFTNDENKCTSYCAYDHLVCYIIPNKTKYKTVHTCAASKVFLVI